jgi:hypothetical protein
MLTANESRLRGMNRSQPIRPQRLIRTVAAAVSPAATSIPFAAAQYCFVAISPRSDRAGYTFNAVAMPSPIPIRELQGRRASKQRHTIVASTFPSASPKIQAGANSHQI